MFRRKERPAPQLAPLLTCLTEGELAAKGWPKDGLSATTRAKLLGLSISSSFSDLPDSQEREQQSVRAAVKGQPEE